MISWTFRPPKAPSATRAELSRQYLRELQEMIDDREIGADLAREILEEMFEPARPWQPRLVKESVWAQYVEAREKHGDRG